MPPLEFKRANDGLSNPSEEAFSMEKVAAEIGRPLSPHFTIYEPQLTWLMSIAHRVTGAGLATGIYAFGLYYAVMVPEAVTGTVANWIASDVPSAVVFAGKYIVAAPFLFHSFNGIRHLVWHSMRGLSLTRV
jgi:succinate dehydrogenase (ubiquinone) cytochrome b560 subunit